MCPSCRQSMRLGGLTGERLKVHQVGGRRRVTAPTGGNDESKSLAACIADCGRRTVEPAAELAWLSAPLTALALTWDATVDTSHVPTLWYTQTSPSFDVTITNTGTATWPAGGPNPAHVPVYFSYENRVTRC